MKKSLLISLIIFVSLLAVLAILTKTAIIPNYLAIEFLCPESQEEQTTPDMFEPIDKPVIYLYPEKATDVSVQLDFKGEFMVTYPSYNNGWEVTAYPDGRLINKQDKREYSYLFWEGINSQRVDYDLSTGFVIKGEDTVEFLQEKLEYLGLTPKEYNEFIVYWYPLMKDNDYNLIHFAQEKYTDQAKLKVIPTPDSILRVFMVFKPLESYIQIPEQKLERFSRTGFSVIEWGGSKL